MAATHTSAFSSLSKASGANVAKPPALAGKDDIDVAARLGMVHGLWGREVTGKVVCGPKIKTRKSMVASDTQGSTFFNTALATPTQAAAAARGFAGGNDDLPPSGQASSPIGASSMHLSSRDNLDRSNAERASIIAQQARDLVRNVGSKERGRLVGDDYCEARFDLLESLNALRHKGDELAKEGAEDQDEDVSLLDKILTATSDDEPKLTSMIEALMDAQEASRQQGGAQHATIHVVNRCCRAARHKRELLDGITDLLGELKHSDLQSIANLRRFLAQSVHQGIPTAPDHGLHPDHDLVQLARTNLQQAMDDLTQMIIEFANQTDSADFVDKMVKDAITIAGVSKSHPGIAEAKRLANAVREGERLRQRHAAQEKKQAEMRAKMEAEERAKKAAMAAAMKKKGSALFKGAIFMVKAGLRLPQGAKAPGPG
eukprot:gnl/MRDRNA2_/MRDRNA2_107846_c0_seq1.p1 gnl/MRDRNA2_/MRDRNA2_107846_c0~~gnl/MRDRNA2_/MRDRNA2_107846_c0_seq1.p1  ORF type:complete len:430 (+),score=98.67 gnl/MRDRNA2_/MRDRNA2_107846_c0_seq1:548-1837(+)